MKYEIKCGAFPVVECSLYNGESVVCQAGAMVWMSPNLEMQTKGGGAGKVLGRMLTSESMFQNIYTAKGDAVIAFGTNFPGRILPVEIVPGCELILQKSAFLACEPTVELELYTNKKIGVGLFGGEGFLMNKLSGRGLAFVEVGGEMVEKALAPGERIVVQTGNVLGLEASVSMDISQVKGLKNKLLGGEGFFNTILTGPGKVWLQSMSISSMAGVLSPYMSMSSN